MSIWQIGLYTSVSIIQTCLFYDIGPYIILRIEQTWTNIQHTFFSLKVSFHQESNKKSQVILFSMLCQQFNCMLNLSKSSNSYRYVLKTKTASAVLTDMPGRQGNTCQWLRNIADIIME